MLPMLLLFVLSTNVGPASLLPSHRSLLFANGHNCDDWHAESTASINLHTWHGNSRSQVPNRLTKGRHFVLWPSLEEGAKQL